MIRVSGLTKDYGTRRAIQELDFHINKGEIVGFLGPNGAGKTTTMRILSGYMPPTFGKAEIGGFDLMEKSLEVRRIVGYLPETVPLYPDMTINEYLNYMANLRHISNKKSRIEEVLDKVNLTERATSLIGNLSKGLRQRVGLAQAIFHQPEVLILDEPTIGLDPAQIREFRNIIQEIGKEHTVILSTHILPEAQQVCSRVLIINKGHIVAEDSPEQLQARLTGSQHITLRTLGDSDKVEKLLNDIPGVIDPVFNNDNLWEFESPAGEEVRPIIARSIVEAGIDLVDLHAENMSLEEIFLELTRDEPRLELSESDNIEIEERQENA